MDRATVRLAHFYSGFEGSSLAGDCNHPTIRRNRQSGRHCPNDRFIIPPILTRRVRRAVSHYTFKALFRGVSPPSQHRIATGENRATVALLRFRLRPGFCASLFGDPLRSFAA